MLGRRLGGPAAHDALRLVEDGPGQEARGPHQGGLPGGEEQFFAARRALLPALRLATWMRGT